LLEQKHTGKDGTKPKTVGCALIAIGDTPMPRKTETLEIQVERARLLALLNVYDAISAAGVRARLFYATSGASLGDIPESLLAELRNQAVTLTALAPPVEIAPDAVSEQLTRMFLGMFPGLATHLPEEEYKP
jgi:hypothetical protein